MFGVYSIFFATQVRNSNCWLFAHEVNFMEVETGYVGRLIVAIALATAKPLLLHPHGSLAHWMPSNAIAQYYNVCDLYISVN